jgi:hypothetical protein
MKNIVAIFLALGIGTAGVSGCTSVRGQQGAVVGGVAGAAIGGLSSRSLGGAVVGGAVGATAGYILGSRSYSCRKTSIFTGRHYIGTCFR